MAHRIEYQASGAIVWIVMEGTVTLDDIRVAVQELTSDASFLVDRRLWDIRGADLRLTTDDLRDIAVEANVRTARPSRVAVLADHDLGYGLARIHQVYRESVTTKVAVFRDETGALEWLAGE